MLTAANIAVSNRRNRPSTSIANMTGTRAASVAPRLVAATMASVANQTRNPEDETLR